MAKLTPDPIGADGIAGYAARLRKREITAEAATKAYLARIDALDPRLGAFQHVAREQALACARGIDALLAGGIDLGPLMGVPVAIKDLFAVEGMPTTAGSKVDVSDLIGSEGSFVRALKRAGCVILGKTKTVEFALGITGISSARGTPVNPWDAKVHRLPGGSSSGSAVALAAGLCGFSIGSDTGGSVRMPAALCGVFGLKTTGGLLPTDGVFPLSRDLDTVGALTRSAADAAIVLEVLTGRRAPGPAPLRGLRLGRPDAYFYQGLEPAVASCLDKALAVLEKAGVEIVPIDVPEAPEREQYFPTVLPSCLIAVLGRERFLAGRDKMDPVVAARGDNGLTALGADVIRLESRRREACRIVDSERFRGLHGWVMATATILPPAVTELEDIKRGMQLTLGMTQNTQPGNYLGLCGMTIPIHGLGAPLPVGMQILCPAGRDARVVSIARAIEDVVGAAPKPNLEAFL
jgi:aspartyl-tRNA(Asn)/glutamyl-tRNA(Gln) amidotransferase subunit A